MEHRNRRGLAMDGRKESLAIEDLESGQETITENPRNNSISREPKFFVFALLEILVFNGLLFYFRLRFIFISYTPENRSFVSSFITFPIWNGRPRG